MGDMYRVSIMEFIGAEAITWEKTGTNDSTRQKDYFCQHYKMGGYITHGLTAHLAAENHHGGIEYGAENTARNAKRLPGNGTLPHGHHGANTEYDKRNDFTTSWLGLGNGSIAPVDYHSYDGSNYRKRGPDYLVERQGNGHEGHIVCGNVGCL